MPMTRRAAGGRTRSRRWRAGTRHNKRHRDVGGFETDWWAQERAKFEALESAINARLLAAANTREW